MNTNILKKCVDELKKETPKIDYVLGMLESVIELSGQTPVVSPIHNKFAIRGLDPLVSATTGSGLLDIERVDELADSYVTTPGPVAKLH